MLSNTIVINMNIVLHFFIYYLPQTKIIQLITLLRWVLRTLRIAFVIRWESTICYDSFGNRCWHTIPHRITTILAGRLSLCCSCPLNEPHLCATGAAWHDGGMSKRHDTQERWRRILQEHRASGLSVTQFCRRAGVPQSSFFAWQRKLRNAVTFTEVKLSPTAATISDGIELRLPGRRGVVVRPGFDRQTLLDVLHLLEADASTGARRETGL